MAPLFPKQLTALTCPFIGKGVCIYVCVCVLQELTSVIAADSSLPENTPKKTNARTEACTHLYRCVDANMSLCHLHSHICVWKYEFLKCVFDI